MAKAKVARKKKPAPRRGRLIGLAVALVGGGLGTWLLVAVLTWSPEPAPPRVIKDWKTELARAEEWEPAPGEEPQPLPGQAELSHLDAVKAITSIAGDRAPSQSKGRPQAQSQSRAPANGLLLWPAGVTALSSGFGYRSNPLTGAALQLHRGVDVRAPCGSEVVATAGGVVTFADWTDSSGNTVKISHGHGLSSRYLHLSALKVNVGDHVNAGDRVGFSGDTGRMSTGPHLHFELWKDNEPINPMAFRYHYLAPSALARSSGVVCGGGYSSGVMAMGDPGRGSGSTAEDIYSSFLR